MQLVERDTKVGSRNRFVVLRDDGTIALMTSHKTIARNLIHGSLTNSEETETDSQSQDTD